MTISKRKLAARKAADTKAFNERICKESKLLEDTFRTWLKEAHFLPESILVAFHNVCVHGDGIEDAGYNVNIDQLDEMFDGLDKSLEALRSMRT